MKTNSIHKLLATALTLAALAQGLAGCSDEPAAENYYTATGEMVSDYLDNRPELYSEFTQILQRSGLYGRMATYGAYTCLAPTNEAVDQYLAQHGYASVADIPQDECDTLSWNHLIDATYFTSDLSIGAIPSNNMNDRTLTFSCDSSAQNGGNLIYYVNNSRLIVRDDSVQNGVVHTLDRVIQPSKLYLPDKLMDDPAISIFAEALILTRLKDSLYAGEDPTYHVSPDSIKHSTIGAIPFHRSQQTYRMSYPEKRRKQFTALVEPNTVLEAAGIRSLDDLKAYAKQVYDAVYPEDAGLYDNDWTHRKNPLNRFVAYHLLPYKSALNNFTISESGINYKTICSMPNLIDATDWFTTLMPGTIMKFSSPSEGVFINRKGVAANYTVRGVMVYPENEQRTMYEAALAASGRTAEESFSQLALNGIYHYIDQVLTYNTQTRDVVFNDRIRWNVVTLSPEFLNADARGNTDGQNLYAFKVVDGWEFRGGTPTLCMRERGLYMNSYSDAIDLIGQFDISFRLPPVPANTYEIRFAYGANPDRGVVQIYFGEKGNLQPMGLPIDFTMGGGDPRIGWVADVDDDEEANRAIDKAMHNRGIMKDIDSWTVNGGSTLRSLSYKFRKILTTQTLDPNKEYWVRIKLVVDNDQAELPLNYFEFCPKSVYAGLVAEDTH